MTEFVLWKPLYYTSIGMFALSLILLPFSAAWSIMVVLSLVAIWSRVPGMIHWFFGKLSVTDLFTFIVAVNLGPLAGVVFGTFTMLFGKLFGPLEDPLVLFRLTLGYIIASLATPLIVHFTGPGVLAFYVWQTVSYLLYYTLVVLFFKEEIGIEVVYFPVVIGVDYFMNGFLVVLFGDTIGNMMTQGLSSGWPFIVFAGMILGFLTLAKNADRIGHWIGMHWRRFRNIEEIKEKKRVYDENHGGMAPRFKEESVPQLKNDVVVQKIDAFEHRKKKEGFFSKLLGKVAE